MEWLVYLSGEIHTNWRENIIIGSKKVGLKVDFIGPITDHDASDDCGAIIMGKEEEKFWHDHKSAKLNAIRTRTAIENSDIVVVMKFPFKEIIFFSTPKSKSIIFFGRFDPIAIFSMYISGAFSKLPFSETANTDKALGKFFAVKFVPSKGSTAISSSSPLLVPTFSFT